jgi:hypothetical protein
MIVRMRHGVLVLAIALVLGAPAAARAGAGSVAIFFYPWYGTAASDGSYLHWRQNGHVPPRDIASDYYPERGVYSSGAGAVLAAQMAQIARAGVDEVVSSWWGTGSVEDHRLPAVAAAARAAGLKLAVQIEPYAGRSAESVAADVARLRGLGVREFYVYQPEDVPDADWAALNDSLAASGQPRLIAQTALAGRAAAGHFGGLYTYDVLSYDGEDFARICDEAHALHLLCLPSVGPGYDARRATGDPRVRPRLNGATYDDMWRGAILGGADGITITSYNEWHEGTQIEPAIARGGPRGFRYAGYAGAWGTTGRAAPFAYLDRTAYWAAKFRAQYRTVASRRR